MRNTRIKKEMNDWLAIYRRQNVSVGRQDGSDPVSSSVCDFVVKRRVCLPVKQVMLKGSQLSEQNEFNSMRIFEMSNCLM